MLYHNTSGHEIHEKGVVFKKGEKRDLTPDEVRKLGTPLPAGLVVVQEPKVPVSADTKKVEEKPKAEEAPPVPAPGPAPVVVPNAQGQAIAVRR